MEEGEEPIAPSVPATPEQIRQVLMNTRLAKAVSGLPSKKTPHNWSYRSSSPYYKEYYGKELKGVFDRLAAGGPPEVFSFSDGRQKNMLPGTVYLRVNQSILYLLEQLDTEDDYYKKLRKRIVVERKLGLGIKLSLRPDGITEDAKSFKPMTEHQMVTEAPRWKRILLEWVSNANVGDEYDKEGLSLTASEVKELEVEFRDKPEWKDKFISSITRNRIVVFRIPTPEEAGA